jgi:hypothetical protein
MPVVTVAKPKLLKGPGVLYGAPLGTTLPTNTVAGSIFTDAWTSPWVPLGATDEGSEFTIDETSEDILVAEISDPIDVDPTGRVATMAFALASITKSTLLYAYGAGSGAATVTGTGATTLTTITPPAPSAKVGKMLGWESTDATYRIIFPNGWTSIGSRAFRKGGKAVPALTVRALTDSSGNPFYEYLAGADRGA